MRCCRNFKTNRCYHLISRVAHRAFFLDDGEKTRLVDFLWRAADFSGVTVIAYAVMTNHFHIVVYVPDRADLSSDNPVKAGIVEWPDAYRWCSFAAACTGDLRAVAGYDFIFSARGRGWDELRPLVEMSVREALAEIARRKEESASLAEGLSVNARKRDLVVERRYRRLEAELPRHVPHLVERGRDKVAFDLLRLLSEGEMRPADLREQLGVRSRSYFTLRYLSPLVASGYVEMTDPSHPRSSTQTYRLTPRGRKAVA